MAHGLSEHEESFQREVRRVVQEKIAPGADEREERGEYPWDMVALFREQGWFRLFISEKYGGIGAGVLYRALLLEEVSKVCNNCAAMLALTGLGATPIIQAASEEQKQKYLPPMASGDVMVAYGLTEPHAGSDAAAISTRAVLDGDHYVVNGTKCFISQADVARTMTLFARTDLEVKPSRGISAFIVELDPEKGTPGYSVLKAERKMSMKAVHTCQIALDNLRIPRENLISGEGRGFYIAMHTLDECRILAAAQGLGIAQGALDYAIAYMKEREAFGSPIINFQGLQFMLADMAASTEAARQLVYTAARNCDEEGPDIPYYGALAKMVATDVGFKVASDAVSLLGGYGCMRDHPVERLMRDAKVAQQYEGTNQVQRLVIARRLAAR